VLGRRFYAASKIADCASRLMARASTQRAAQAFGLVVVPLAADGVQAGRPQHK